MTILATRNQPWGFFGTIEMTGADPIPAWNAASALIGAATNATPEAVRDFLDNRHGRHFADDVASELAVSGKLEDAVAAAIARWQGWRIGRRTARDDGIPAGLPYLTGWIGHFQGLHEMEA
jgi:hypothetical protein